MVGAGTAIATEAMDESEIELVRAELERICSDPLFRDTTRMKRFLRYVTEETLEGRGGRLKGYVIGVEVFDRPDDFDPQGDTIVRVQAGQLRRRLDLFYLERGQDSAVRILVPKGRYAPTFEMRQSVEADETADPQALIERNKNPRPSIAVMTLDDLSQDQAPRFADGLTAEIVNALVQFRSVRIVTLTPRVSSVLAQKSVRDVGKEANADFVLSGSVRRDKEVFRVTVSLIRAETGEHLFSRVFDREYQPGSLFNLQEEIASYTAAAVAAPFGAVNRYNRRTRNFRATTVEGYDLVLRYYDIHLSPTRNNAEELLKDFETVTDANPDFSTGWAIRAKLNNFLCTLCFPSADPNIHLIEADRCARRALSMDGQNAMGYYGLFQSYYHRGDFEKANKMIRRALSLNPNNYSMLAYYAVCLALRGETDRALAMQSAALRLIGRAPPWFHVPQLIIDFREEQYETIAGLIGEDIVAAPAVFQLFGLAAKGYLSQAKEANLLVQRLVADYPAYLDEAAKALRLWHLSPDLAAKVNEGLARAGLDIGDLNASK